MSARKKIIVFFQSFILLVLAMLVLGELYLFLTAAPIADLEQSRIAREAASAVFGTRYHLLMILGSMAIASAIAFRWIGALVGGAVAVALYLVVPPSILNSLNLSSFASLGRNWHLPSSDFRGEDALPGQQMVLATPITVQSRYGKAKIPAGTSVKVLRQEGDSIWISVLGGETTIVTRAFLQ